jgi:exosome complex RNA-binding protein Rrp4
LSFSRLRIRQKDIYILYTDYIKTYIPHAGDVLVGR